MTPKDSPSEGRGTVPGRGLFLDRRDCLARTGAGGQKGTYGGGQNQDTTPTVRLFWASALGMNCWVRGLTRTWSRK